MEKDNNAISVPEWGTSRQGESNLELFRILTMLLIIAHHYVVNSGLTTIIYEDPTSLRSIFLLLFGAWGKTGINCFLMITGYFMCKSKITVRKFVKLVAEVVFYRILFYVIFVLTGYIPFSAKEFIMAAMPITAVQQNFTGCYLIFYLFIPFLNILLQNITEKQHIQLVVLTGFTYIILGTLPMTDVTMNYVSWYCVLYFMASYIRMYPKSIFDNTRFWGWMALGSFFVSVLSVIVCDWLGTNIGKHMSYYFVSDSNKILAVTTALCAFMFFKNMRLGYKKWINTVAASTFGVLMIHANSDAMREWLWKDVLNNVGMYHSKWMVIHAVGSVVAIFAICTAIDYLRIHFVEKPVEKVITAWALKDVKREYTEG